jgi:NAD-dependent dihydropyrimidine dehydrogenase PreA subunit
MDVRSETGMFVRVEVDDPTASDPAASKQLEAVCPVDIFADKAGHVAIVEDNVDECILCGLCLEVGAEGSVRVVKLYDNDALLQKT